MTGLSVATVGGQHRLCKSGTPVKAVSLPDAMTNFLEWLGQQGSIQVLVGHNSRSFDQRVLFNQLQLCNSVNQSTALVSGFADTLLAFRSAFPGLSSYKQESLVTEFLGTAYDAHDTIEDVSSLQQLTRKLTLEQLPAAIATASSTLAMHRKLAADKVATNTLLLNAIPKACLSAGMALKIAASGLVYQDLQLVFARNGTDGLTALLREPGPDGKPCVTKTLPVLTTLAGHFQPSMQQLPCHRRKTFSQEERRGVRSA